MKLNRIKVVLAEEGKSNNWLAKKIGKSVVTISRWCTNETQPSLESLWKVAKALNVDMRKLIISGKENR